MADKPDDARMPSTSSKSMAGSGSCPKASGPSTTGRMARSTRQSMYHEDIDTYRYDSGGDE